MPAQAENDIKIRVNNLTKRFGDLTVLDGINFTIRKGELLAIVGPTGCGKTTFLNCLSKLMPATEGDILIDITRIASHAQSEDANSVTILLTYLFIDIASRACDTALIRILMCNIQTSRHTAGGGTNNP